MPKYLHFGIWNRNNKFVFLSAFFAFLTNYIYGFTYSDYLNEIKITTNIFNIDPIYNNHIIINYIFRYLGLILFALVLYKYELYIKYSIFKSYSGDDIFKSYSIKLIYNNSEQNTKNKIFISPMFILLIMIIMVLQEISEDLFYRSNLRALDFWMLELPLLSYLNLRYFKFGIYLHHKLVIYLNLIICGIIKIIYLIISIKDDKSEVFKCYNEYWGVIPLGILTYLIIIISRAFALNEIKVLMQYKYISPIKLLIVYGIIGAIITTIIGLISSFFECNKINSSLDLLICKIKEKEKDKFYLDNFKIWFDDIKKISELLSLLFGMFINFFYKLFYILIIRNLTAIHIIFSNLIYTSFLIWIGFTSNNKDDNNKDDNNYILIGKIIIQIVIIFGLLIYLEIIELDFCNLNYDSKKNISRRSAEDYELKSNTSDNDIISLNTSFNSINFNS